MLVMVGLSRGKLEDEGVQLLPEHPWNRDGEICWLFPSFHSPVSLAEGSPSWTLADRGGWEMQAGGVRPQDTEQSRGLAMEHLRANTSENTWCSCNAWSVVGMVSSSWREDKAHLRRRHSSGTSPQLCHLISFTRNQLDPFFSFSYKRIKVSNCSSPSRPYSSGIWREALKARE